jgi:tRNA-modifying protein YgfZ
MEATTALELDAQYRVMREGAGLLVRRERRLLRVGGPEAAEYLQGQVTNDVEAIAPGEGCYAALLDRKGHMQADMRVLRLADDELLLDTEAIASDAVLRHLSTYRVGRDVEVADVSESAVILSVIGPGAARVIGEAPLGAEHAHREAQLGAIRARLVATDLGADAFIAAGDARAAEGALRDSGAEPVSAEAVEIVRVESGRPRFGAEMTTATIPQEAGINERAVSFAKGCYIGQETVARLHYRGKPNRHLRGLRLSATAAREDSVVLGERELGVVGTAVLSPAHGPIALAILRREAEPGATVEVAGAAATVVELPFTT